MAAPILQPINAQAINLGELFNAYWPIVSTILSGAGVIVGAISLFIILWWVKRESEDTSLGDLLFYLLLIIAVGVALIAIGQVFIYYLFLVALLIIYAVK
jgi:hypothetical protein